MSFDPAYNRVHESSLRAWDVYIEIRDELSSKYGHQDYTEYSTEDRALIEAAATVHLNRNARFLNLTANMRAARSAA